MTVTVDHAKQQAAAQLESIRSMVAAMNCDYGRLAELRELETGNHLDKPELDELADLIAAATIDGDELDADTARERIQDDALSVEVRSGWYSLGMEGCDSSPAEYCILLCTGGPACRIVGALDRGEPSSAHLEYQDWGTPWTEYWVSAADEAILLDYARCFYFGE